MSELRWGILSTADIARTKVIPGIRRADRCRIAVRTSSPLNRGCRSSSAGVSSGTGKIPRRRCRFALEALPVEPRARGIQLRELDARLHILWVEVDHPFQDGQGVAGSALLFVQPGDLLVVQQALRAVPELLVQLGQSKVQLRARWVDGEHLLVDGDGF